jgi:hypothetical protein
MSKIKKPARNKELTSVYGIRHNNHRNSWDGERLEQAVACVWTDEVSGNNRVQAFNPKWNANKNTNGVKERIKTITDIVCFNSPTIALFQNPKRDENGYPSIQGYAGWAKVTGVETVNGITYFVHEGIQSLEELVVDEGVDEQYDMVIVNPPYEVETQTIGRACR